MRRELSIYERYLELARAKKRGRWRFPLWVCVAIYILISPLILLIEGLVGVAIMALVEPGFIPAAAGLMAMVVAMLAVAGALAELIYFGLRKSATKNNGHCCQHCGYNLTGNVSGVCPECGTPINKTRQSDKP